MHPSNDPWKVAIIVGKETRDETDRTVTQLRKLGLDALHVFALPTAKINKQRDVIVHQSKEWRSEYDIWKSTCHNMADTYGAQTDLFLFIKPKMQLWEQLPVYCEATIERELVGVWSPFTPTRVFPDEYPERPECYGGFGWCKSQVNASLVTNHCLVMTRHALALVASYLPKHSELGANTPGAIALAMAKQQLPFYFHTPSLAAYNGWELSSDDFVGSWYDMPQKDMYAKNFILPKEKTTA